MTDDRQHRGGGGGGEEKRSPEYIIAQFSCVLSCQFGVRGAAGTHLQKKGGKGGGIHYHLVSRGRFKLSERISDR